MTAPGGVGYGVDLHGFKELGDALDKLPGIVAKEILGDAAKAAGKVIQEDAVRRAPRRSGRLASQIKVRISRKEGRATAKIGVRTNRKKGLAWYAGLMEFGVKAHTIKLRKKSKRKALADPSANAIYGRTVHHPGARARPFLRPALDTQGAAALREAGRVIRAGLEAEARTGIFSERALTKRVKSALGRSRRLRKKLGGG